MHERYHPDVDAYVHRCRTGPCFICEIVAGNPDFYQPVVYEDNDTIAFLKQHPTLFGYVLVSPKEHREQATGDFSPDEYLAFQHVVYRVTEAVRQEVAPERVYILTLGSQQGNSHVHWHIAPLPPGVPYHEQQTASLSWNRGVIKLTDDEMEDLASRLRTRISG